ncbi:hypothetical protein PISMIDRAFT_11053 [Pisolithus microcarpus 441]|uniref:Uncharacterized protein n=1 Tax=Pisolithus microcarpus 441 TaxID=765257 RepID=A0A0C9YEI7_9AGAM|nr:hypothetical protein BKA83DRAFT_11053 [Pisolithus microcarpus]KIK23280.1 hypothetical protein PISMIDRAFT_11053 [Pisolithus microcarpus 441]
MLIQQTGIPESTRVNSGREPFARKKRSSITHKKFQSSTNRHRWTIGTECNNPRQVPLNNRDCSTALLVSPNQTIDSTEEIHSLATEFESKLKVVNTEQGDAFVYAVKSNDENAKTWKFVISLIKQIDLTTDLEKLMLIIMWTSRLSPRRWTVELAAWNPTLHDRYTIAVTRSQPELALT